MATSTSSSGVTLLRSVAPTGAAEVASKSARLDAATLAGAEKIVEAVRERGVAAVLEYGRSLGDLQADNESLFVTPAELEQAFLALPRAQQELLERTAERIRYFARAQRNSLKEFVSEIRGGRCGQSVSVVESAGCYAPGGRYPLPSSVLMTAVTARVAGVKRVIVASPRPAPITLAAAHVARSDGLLRVGGAQAIAALTFGLESGGVPVPPCAVVVGPGNRWVTAAKKLLAGTVGIDMLAGPSECLVLADSTASAGTVAADLLAQAEHDPDARALLVTTDAGLVDRVRAELERQLQTLPTATAARAALTTHGIAVVCANLDEASRVSDIFAPEHLLLQVAPTEQGRLRLQLQNYGALFVGGVAAEVFGDYGVGPNHVLPTGGAARHAGGLSVHTFMRVRTWLQMDAAMTSDIAAIVEDAAALARLEGLEAHARAAECRRPKSADSTTTTSATTAAAAAAATSATGSGAVAVPTAPALRTGENLVKLALPKGRMEVAVLKLLDDAGIKLQVGARGYRPTLNVPGFDVKMLKPQNIVEMLSAGSRDVGFTGFDLVDELGADDAVVDLLDTGLDPVRLVAAVPEAILVPSRDGRGGKELPTDRKLTVATEYLHVARKWVESRGIHAQVVHSRGATEGWPPEDADIIVDNTATGSTLKANALHIVAELMTSSTHLFANPAAMHNPVKKATVERLVTMLRSVLSARERIMLEFHVPKAQLETMVKLVPAMRQPTVSPLYGESLYAVKIVVPRSEVFTLIGNIKAHGASDIIATNLLYIVP